MVLVALIVIASSAIYLYYKLFPDKILDIAGLGKWAVVTGATDGIGKAFTHELAGKGYHIVLVSRTIDKLDSCAKEIENKFQVSTKIIQADFMSLDGQMYSRIKDELKDLDIGVLVNNVGTVACHPEYFLDMETHHANLYQGILNCNITSAIEMTRYVLPGMINKGKGLIINISSQFSTLPSPLHTLYGASKSFLKKFSHDLNTEYCSKGVRVHVLTTGLVATKLSGLKKTSFFAPSPEVYVRSALEEITKRRSCDGYIGHSIFSAVYEVFILLCPEFLGKIVMKYLNHVRKLQIKRCKECRPRDERNS
uniref:Estradiol 17-beta-dehydrogenase 12 n=1 Tax=Lygus hesperus TaxID=30085 RepID=A0A0A9YRJ9_LYGHE